MNKNQLSQKPEIDHSTKFAPQAVDFLQEKFVNGQHERREQLSTFSATEITSCIKKFASIVCGNGTEFEQPYDGQTVQVGGGALLAGFPATYVPPVFEDKQSIIDEAWGVSTSMLQDASIQDDEALLQVGMLMSSVVALTHPYSDGNGRVSRLLGVGIIFDHEQTKYATKVVIDKKGGSYFYTNPFPTGRYAAAHMLETQELQALSQEEKAITTLFAGSNYYGGSHSDWPADKIETARKVILNSSSISEEGYEEVERSIPSRYVKSFIDLTATNPLVTVTTSDVKQLEKLSHVKSIDAGEHSFRQVRRAWFEGSSLLFAKKTREERVACVAMRQSDIAGLNLD